MKDEEQKKKDNDIKSDEQQQGAQTAPQQSGQPGRGYYGWQGSYQNHYPNQNYGNYGQGNPYGHPGAGYPNGNYGYPGNAGMQGDGRGVSGGKKKSSGKKWLLIACIGIVAVFCGVCIYFAGVMFDETPQETQQTAAQPKEPQIAEVELGKPDETASAEAASPPLPTNLTDVSDLVEKIMPSVVSVNAVYTYSDFYWGDEKYDGGGSGFIIGENETELLIATNSHVVTDSEDLTVSFVDETVADALVKGYDNDLDVAVIAVRLENIEEETKQNIAIAKLGDSTTLKAGQAVVSIGNALLLGQSVTTGIISATNMPVGGGYDEMGNQYGSDERVMIQTTAFMNPGCSGGVLINASGEVVGINTMTISSAEVEGMCYAIPISDAIPILDKLKTREIRERLREADSGYLGISCSNVESKQAEKYGIPNGVYVREVNEDGAARKAGLQKGDIIVALNETSLETMEELSEMLRYYPVGEIVDLEIMRYEKGEYRSQTFSVKLGRR